MNRIFRRNNAGIRCISLKFVVDLNYFSSRSRVPTLGMYKVTSFIFLDLINEHECFLFVYSMLVFRSRKSPIAYLIFSTTPHQSVVVRPWSSSSCTGTTTSPYWLHLELYANLGHNADKLSMQ